MIDLHRIESHIVYATYTGYMFHVMTRPVRLRMAPMIMLTLRYVPSAVRLSFGETNNGI